MVAEQIDGTWYTVFSPPTILGLSRDYANYSAWLKENLNPVSEQEFRLAEGQCHGANSEIFKDMNLSKYFKRGYSSTLDPVPSSVMKWSGEYLNSTRGEIR